MKKSGIAVGIAIVVVTLTACSGAPSSDEGDTSKPTVTKKVADPKQSSGGTTTPGTDTSRTDPTPSGPCVPEGTKGNELGVGAFCSTSVACASGLLCTAAYAPVGAQFCTIVCSVDSDCGANATCYHEARGSGCTPNACLSK